MNFYVLCPITDNDWNNTVAVKFPQCKTFAVVIANYGQNTYENHGCTNLHRDAVLDEEADLDVHGVEVLLQLLVLADQLRYVA